MKRKIDKGYSGRLKELHDAQSRLEPRQKQGSAKELDIGIRSPLKQHSKEQEETLNSSQTMLESGHGGEFQAQQSVQHYQQTGTSKVFTHEGNERRTAEREESEVFKVNADNIDDILSTERRNGSREGRHETGDTDVLFQVVPETGNGNSAFKAVSTVSSASHRDSLEHKGMKPSSNSGSSRRMYPAFLKSFSGTTARKGSLKQASKTLKSQYSLPGASVEKNGFGEMGKENGGEGDPSRKSFVNRALNMFQLFPDRRSSPNRVTSKPRHWTPEEDELLRKAVKMYGEKRWKQIAEHVPGRNHTQCLQRWSKVLAPGLKKGQWSKAEDDALIRLAQAEIQKMKAHLKITSDSTSATLGNRKIKLNWGKVARNIEGRTAKQCRERWVNNLDPEINKSAWTKEEDMALMQLQELYPKKWAMISKHLPGRTENAVKIRFKSLTRNLKTDKEKERYYDSLKEYSRKNDLKTQLQIVKEMYEQRVQQANYQKQLQKQHEQQNQQKHQNQAQHQPQPQPQQTAFSPISIGNSFLHSHAQQNTPNLNTLIGTNRRSNPQIKRETQGPQGSSSQHGNVHGNHPMLNNAAVPLNGYDYRRLDSLNLMSARPAMAHTSLMNGMHAAHNPGFSSYGSPQGYGSTVPVNREMSGEDRELRDEQGRRYSLTRQFSTLSTADKDPRGDPNSMSSFDPSLNVSQPVQQMMNIRNMRANLEKGKDASERSLWSETKDLFMPIGINSTNSTHTLTDLLNQAPNGTQRPPGSSSNLEALNLRTGTPSSANFDYGNFSNSFYRNSGLGMGSYASFTQQESDRNLAFQEQAPIASAAEETTGVDEAHNISALNLLDPRSKFKKAASDKSTLSVDMAECYSLLKN